MNVETFQTFEILVSVYRKQQEREGKNRRRAQDDMSKNKTPSGSVSTALQGILDSRIETT